MFNVDCEMYLLHIKYVYYIWFHQYAFIISKQGTSVFIRILEIFQDGGGVVDVDVGGGGVGFGVGGGGGGIGGGDDTYCRCGDGS